MAARSLRGAGAGCLRRILHRPAACSLQGRTLPSPHAERSVPLGRPAGATGLRQPPDPHKEGPPDAQPRNPHRQTHRSDPSSTTAPAPRSARLRLAVQRPRGKDGEDRGADFVDVTVFGNQAQVCNQYLAKGRRVAIEGRLQHSEWQAEDGSRRQKLEVIASSVEFLDRKPSEDQQPEAVEAAA